MTPTLGLSIPTRNRALLTIKAFEKVIDDPRLSDITLVDDCSNDGSFEYLRDTFASHEKVRVIGQANWRGMQQNKADAVALNRAEWVILFDSDNELGPDYIDALFKAINVFESDEEIFMPSRALPNFLYDEFSGLDIWPGDIKALSKKKLFGALLNTSNYVVNKDFYSKVYEWNPEVKGCDTIWHAYNHLRKGGSFHVVKGMEYQHKVWDQSEYMKDLSYNMKHAKEIEDLIKAL